METESFNAPRTPEEETRDISDDSSARKMFIQEVCNAVQESTSIYLTGCTESKPPPLTATKCHAQCHRPPIRPPCLRSRSTQPQMPPTLILRPLHTTPLVAQAIHHIPHLIISTEDATNWHFGVHFYPPPQHPRSPRSTVPIFFQHCPAPCEEALTTNST